MAYSFVIPKKDADFGFMQVIQTKLKEVKNKLCFRSFTYNKVAYSFLNEDSVLDACFYFSFFVCDGKPQDHPQQSKFLVLSKKEDYFVDETFFNFPAIDSLGEFYLDSMSGNQFYGYLIYKPTVPDSIKNSRNIQLEYPAKKIIFR